MEQNGINGIFDVSMIKISNLIVEVFPVPALLTAHFTDRQVYSTDTSKIYQIWEFRDWLQCLSEDFLETDCTFRFRLLLDI
ncbi:30968_t:CDS:2 [Gigaspora margarita]|uniref:30968_t:CDS:1 n=1 Tax=Gigaspora margarita TaxID=4874 RepID=A0ABM8VVR9_GIGMA|nr:30968_t:CDS:2 [Gigaspora margarita]